jgi:hypothetical protein
MAARAAFDMPSASAASVTLLGDFGEQLQFSPAVQVFPQVEKSFGKRRYLCEF